MKRAYTPEGLSVVAARLLLVLLCCLPVAGTVAQSSTCTGQDPAGASARNGLYSEYYSGYFADNQRFFTANTPGLIRVDAEVNFPARGFGDLTSVATNTLADPNEFSLCQRGSLSINMAGLYTFYLTSDDASFLWLGNAALAQPAVAAQATIEYGGQHPAGTRQASLYLTAGQHNLLLHYGDAGGNNVLVLEYEGPDAPTRRVIPAAALCTAVQPARNLPTALQYAPSSATVLAGAGAVSPVPTSVGGGAAVRFELANAAQLPTGISIDAGTGQLTLAGSVGPGLYQADVMVVAADGAVLFRQVYTFVVAADAVPPCPGSRPDGGVATRGLYAEYYGGYFNDDPAFFTATTRGLTRLEPQLNFATSASWGDLVPVAIGSSSNPYLFSVRVRGSFTITTAGTYTFYLTSDDASRLWLNNAALRSLPSNSTAVIDNGGRHRDSTVAVTLPLSAGQHDLQVHYGNASGDGTLVLEYQGPDAPTRRVMPAAVFCSGGSGWLLATTAASRRPSLSVAPNPSRGNFEVRIGQQQPGAGQLQLLDAQGRLCYQTTLPAAQEQRLPLQLPGLAAGIYLLRLTTTTGTATQKVVVE